MATPESELVTIPGFSHDLAASRAEATRLLAEVGVHALKLTIMVRDIPMPHYAGADLLVESWRGIGVAATEDRRNIWEWQKVIDAGDFDVALDFSGDFYDDPTIELTKFVSHDLSPVNYSGSTDRFLDALYNGQAVTSDQGQRAKIVRDFELSPDARAQRRSCCRLASRSLDNGAHASEGDAPPQDQRCTAA